MTEERYFSDESIVEQSSAMIKDGDKTTNGISIIVRCPPDVEAVEVLLDYDELKLAIAELEKDRKSMPHLYS